ncbi:hypothetical protein [Elioraea thermophila]|uniref:hypothetical protein n=1 Tax=Elioraea thermophila TaxID=2185104 RepID=UPI001E2AFC88|nr:hypothetical protein [Elioraea thermophila]
MVLQPTGRRTARASRSAADGCWATGPAFSLAALLEGRDLRPTTDLRSVAKALLGAHLGVPAALLDTVVFPNSAAVHPLAGLV